jgi:hypothetical protein
VSRLYVELRVFDVSIGGDLIRRSDAGEQAGQLIRLKIRRNHEVSRRGEALALTSSDAERRFLTLRLAEVTN